MKHIWLTLKERLRCCNQRCLLLRLDSDLTLAVDFNVCFCVTPFGIMHQYMYWSVINLLECLFWLWINNNVRNFRSEVDRLSTFAGRDGLDKFSDLYGHTSKRRKLESTGISPPHGCNFERHLFVFGEVSKQDAERLATSRLGDQHVKWNAMAAEPSTEL